ncbi:MAG: glycosyltransferase [Chthoniobacteraceae bacterium]
MKFFLFYHTLVSDWNHGNAHFLRGITSELIARGHEVHVYEPRDSWSRETLIAEQGPAVIDDFHRAYPTLTSSLYDPDLDLDQALDGADVVIVHEWNRTALVQRIGQHRREGGAYQLFFHDTHHRAVTAREEMKAYDLSGFDGVLAYGEVLREIYLREGWAARAWTWHEAADARVFHPMPEIKRTRDLVWIGNWGDDERTAELHRFLFQPVKALRLDAQVFGVRYPEMGFRALADAGIEYGGWLPNFRVPEIFAQFRLTVHIPRLPYARELRGIPTIRPFEALACGIPLISTPWEDAEGLFTPGRDYLVAHDEREMQKHLKALLADKAMARELAEHGRRTILARHTCAHRVDELLAICGG